MIDVGFAYSVSDEVASRIVKPTSNYFAGVELLRWLWGAVAQWSEHLQLKQEALGSIPGGYPGFFSLPAGLLM